MKIKLKLGQEQEPFQTGMPVKTLVRVGICSCTVDPWGAGICFDGKANFKQVWSIAESGIWMKKYCPVNDN